jgi:hypothetical protein
MTAKELIDIIRPIHRRTSCSDDNIANGFYLEEDGVTISRKHHQRCTRCALLEIENGTVKATEANNDIIFEMIWGFRP